MKEINCNIIRDLLPLYEDDAVSGDTAELVREHLKNCPACREELHRMGTPVSVPPVTDAEMLRQFLDGIKKARRKRILIALCVVAVLALLAAIFCFWYTRPVSFADLSPGVDLPPCQEIRIYATYYNGSQDLDDYELTITPEDPAFDQLLSLFEAQTYRRSLGNLLPQGTRHHNTQPGDFRWEVILHYEDEVLFPNGSWGRGDLLQFRDFFGALDVFFDGEIWQATVPDQDQWLSDVMEIIRQFPAEG